MLRPPIAPTVTLLRGLTFLIIANTCVLLGLADEAANAPLLFAPSNDARPISSPSRAEAQQAATQPTPASDVNVFRFTKTRWAADEVATAPNPPSAVALKWRGRQSAPSSRGTLAASRETSGSWQSRSLRARLPVRMVTHERSVDPFHDPFGDRLAQNEQPGLPAPGFDNSTSDRHSAFQPPGGAPAGEPAPGLPDLPSFSGDTELPQLPGTTTDESARPLDELPLGTTETEDDPAAPAFPDYEFPRRPSGPYADLPQLGESDPSAPSMDPATEGGDSSCKRVYNGRDCCMEDAKCKTAQTALRENSITKISLDITAPFAPDAQTVEEEIEKREQRLRTMAEVAGPRKWRNRTGQIVAEGLLTGVRNRRVTIAAEDGDVATIPLSDLSEDDWCFLAAWWEVPTECSLGEDQMAPRIWEPLTFTWKASALCHKPLYFEEVQLERYGHTAGPIFQPVLSGAHFFLNIAVLPYKAGINPPTECQYPLGYYRPGSCAPWLLPPVPISLRGGLLQAGAVLGGVALIP